MLLEIVADTCQNGISFHQWPICHMVLYCTTMARIPAGSAFLTRFHISTANEHSAWPGGTWVFKKIQVSPVCVSMSFYLFHVFLLKCCVWLLFFLYLFVVF